MQWESLQRHGRKPLAVTMSRVCMVWLSIVKECCALGGEGACKKAWASPFGGEHKHHQHILCTDISTFFKPNTHMRLCFHEGSFVAVTLSAHVHQTNLSYDPGLLRTLPGERSSCSEVLAMPLFGSLAIVSPRSTLSKQARCCS
jgi:hypothetical protein